MNHEELREGLQNLGKYLDSQDFKSIFLEEGNEAAMDSLVVPLRISEEMSVDISCNFVYVPEFGDILQFYGHLEVDSLFEENPESFTEPNVLKLINALNQMIPIGQFLFMQDDVDDGKGKNVIGIRYTMFTSLDGEGEMIKCVSVIRFLMHIYELLCSSLVLLLDGVAVQEALDTITELMGM